MSAPRRLAIALSLLAACGDSDPQVEVDAYVGPAYARHDADQRRETALQVARTVLAEVVPAKTSPLSAPEASAEPLHAPEDPEQLEQLLAAVDEVPLDEIGGPARRLASTPPELWAQVRPHLVAERKSPKGDYRSLLDAIGGDVPNRYGHFERSWKKAHGHQIKLSEDWFEDLLLLPPGRVTKGLRAVYRDCVQQTALMRAASRAGREDPSVTAEVVAALLDVAYLHEGTFRDEVGRAIVAIGDQAIPHLLIESIRPPGSADDSIEARRAEYAQLQLDRMDRLHPSRAAEAVREDPRLLALVLNAYGTVRPGEAASVLLEFVDAVDPAVRAAARASFAAYVTGPPPVAEHRTVRLLGGGTANRRTALTYRQRAAIAIRERLQGEAAELLEDPCELTREDGSYDVQCEGQPERLTMAYFAWLDARREASDEAALASALAEPDPRARVEELDRLLVSNPELSVGPRLVPVYTDAAQWALEAGDVARAGQLLRKAGRLAGREDPEAERALQVSALLAEASVEGLSPDGRQMLLSSAAAIDPDDPRVSAAMAKLQQQRLDQGAAAQTRGRWAPMLGMLFGLWFLGAAGSWWRRRQTPALAQ